MKTKFIIAILFSAAALLSFRVISGTPNNSSSATTTNQGTVGGFATEEMHR